MPKYVFNFKEKIELEHFQIKNNTFYPTDSLINVENKEKAFFTNITV